MKPKAYIETSIVSYLAAWQSRDLVRAAHQQVTRDWWASRGNFELFASQFVLDEAAAGDEGAAARRLAALAEAAVLEVTENAIVLAEKLITGGGLPSRARVDALHVAMAAVHGMDYLLTWNCRRTRRCVARLKTCAERRASSRRPSARRLSCRRSRRDGTRSDYRGDSRNPRGALEGVGRRHP